MPDGWIDPECAEAAWLEIIALDVWGRPLPEVQVEGAGSPVPLLAGEQTSWRLVSPGLVASDVTAAWSGELRADSVTATASGGARWALSLDAGDVDGHTCAVYGLFVGLDHPLFAASGRAPEAGNSVELLMDGEQLWGRVYEDLTAPREAVRVHQSTWWWESDHELVRTTEPLSAEARWAHAMLGLMQARGGVHRVLVARFAAETAPGLAYQNNDEALRTHATEPDDDIEVVLQSNPTLVTLPGHYDVPARPFSFVARVLDNPAYADRTFAQPAMISAPLVSIEAASMHQKAMVIDGDIAYVHGMNVKNQDWDGSEHRLFDARRMRFEATDKERQAVAAREAAPDWEPRKDYGVRIQGPAARVVDAVLQQRWDHARATGELYAEHTTPYELLPAAAPAGTVTVQVVVTNPEPLQERSILETHLKASSLATDLIFIEDQYWRAPILHEALIAVMDANPALHLIVITQDISDSNGAKKHTFLADDTFRSRYPDRYLLLQIKAFGRDAAGLPVFESIFLHSKLHLVDNAYLSVGSCNKNNRGYLYEGEMNVAIADPAFVTDARARILANLVGPARSPETVGKDGATVYAVLKQVSEANAAVEAQLSEDPTADVSPEGIVFPLAFSSTWVLDVGPDLF